MSIELTLEKFLPVTRHIVFDYAVLWDFVGDGDGDELCLCHLVHCRLQFVHTCV